MASSKLVGIALCLLQVHFRITSSHNKECPAVMDVAFMLDASQGVQTTVDFEATKVFIKAVVSHFVISSSATHIALMTFASFPVVKHFLKDRQDIKAIHQAVDQFSQPGRGKNMVIAFNEARRMLTSGEGGRTQFPRVLVIATDGHDSYPDLAIDSSQYLKDDGVVIISLGITTNVNKTQLGALASSPSHVLLLPHIGSPSDDDFANELSTMICAVIRKPEAIISLVKKKSVLQGHVITTVSAWDEFACVLSCLNTKDCFSFNFTKSSKLCQLNHSNSFSSPDDFIHDFDSVYYELDFT